MREGLKEAARPPALLGISSLSGPDNFKDPLETNQMVIVGVAMNERIEGMLKHLDIAQDEAFWRGDAFRFEACANAIEEVEREVGYAKWDRYVPDRQW